MFLDYKTNLEALQKVTTLLDQEIATLTAKADNVIGVPKVIGEWPKASEFSVHSSGVHLNCDTATLFQYKGWYSSWTTLETVETLTERMIKIEEACAAYDLAAKVVEDANAEDIAYNKGLIERITNIMKHIGVASSYSTYEFPSSRSRTRKSVSHQAGYISDLSRTIKTSIQGSKLDTKDLLRRAKEKFTSLVAEIYRKEREAEAATKKKEDEQKIVFYRVKYTPTNPCSLPEDVLDAILDKCKYLKLAHYLQKNRNDWNDQYSYAEYGISSFVVETEEDKEIEEDIQSCIDSGNESGDYDGRCFRDCTYNYSVLFGKVDEELYTDYNEVRTMNEDY